ncbi:MAG: hypothetical protein EXS10_03965 [Phycisphaerales bacterium]|nr:hypothetical protein [Phycisphaerales bacterium]
MDLRTSTCHECANDGARVADDVSRVHTIAFGLLLVSMGIGIATNASAQEAPSQPEIEWTMLDNAVQWRESDGGNGHCYAIVRVPEFLRWDTAVGMAHAMGGELASLSTRQEFMWVFQHLVDNPLAWSGAAGPWIGAYRDPTAEEAGDPERGWHWVDQTPWKFSPWDLKVGNPPNQNCPGQDECVLRFADAQCNGNPMPQTEDRTMNDACTACAVMELDPRTAVVEFDADCDSDGLVDFAEIVNGIASDHNRNWIPDHCECLGDFDGDGTIAAPDLAVMLQAWGTMGDSVADLNGDGAVNGDDFSILMSLWGTCEFCSVC